MQPQLTLPCPEVGHSKFKKQLGSIVIGDVTKPEQVSKFIRPWQSQSDELGVQYAPGELQKLDLLTAKNIFSHARFIEQTLIKHPDIFRYSQCRIYQFQIQLPSGSSFVFGTIVTDGSHNLIDFCLDTKQAEKRKSVLMGLIRTICTPTSINRKLHH